MANLIQATVYQIDGAPQQPSPIALDFRTREVVIKEATIPTIAAVQSAILYYNVPNNPQSVQTFYVSEDIATLVGAANNAGTSQTQVTVLTINKDPQIPGGVQYSFPSAEILVGEFTDASIGVQAYIQYKNVKYYTQENEAAILAASNNTGVAAGTNPTSLFIPYNNAGIFGDSFLENDAANDILKTVYSASDIGLKLDFFNQVYEFGGVFDLFGIRVNSNNGIDIGDYIGFSNGQQIRIVNDVIKTEYLGNDIGLKLDFANQNYRFGNGITNIGYLEIDSISGIASICGNIGEPLFGIDFLNAVANVGDYLSYNSGTHLSVDDLNQLIKTKNSGADIGLKLDFLNNLYIFGDDSSVASGAFSYAEADSANFTFKIKTGAPAVTNILANNDITKMGDVDVTANGTTFGVDDTAEKLTASANLLSNTAGGTSGQHIKINIGGTDYKIALLNP